jgi:hypothetical protein
MDLFRMGQLTHKFLDGSIHSSPARFSKSAAATPSGQTRKYFSRKDM